MNINNNISAPKTECSVCHRHHNINPTDGTIVQHSVHVSKRKSKGCKGSGKVGK